MRRIFWIVGAAIGVALMSPWSLRGQTYITSTTLAAAVTSPSTDTISVASATGVSAGRVIYVDREAMTVVSVSGTSVRVFRGAFGTVAGTHGNGATVLVGVPAQFVSVDPAPGSCTASDYPNLPLVNVITGNVWLCRYTGPAQTYTRWAATNSTLITYNSLLLNLQ